MGDGGGVWSPLRSLHLDTSFPSDLLSRLVDFCGHEVTTSCLLLSPVAPNPSRASVPWSACGPPSPLAWCLEDGFIVRLKDNYLPLC